MSECFLMFIYIHILMNISEKTVLSILPKDTLVYQLQQPGINPPIFQLVNNLLYLLSPTHPLPQMRAMAYDRNSWCKVHLKAPT